MSTGLSVPPGHAVSQSSSGFAWPRDVTPAERESLIAGGLGWMLDAMDVMLYSLVLTYLIREFSMDTRTAGFLNSLTLVASAIGGLLFGMVADRIGRTRSLMVSILVYSLASAACAFSHSVAQLAVFRFVLGLGMGGEWTAAAALIAETWRPEHRGKALGLMQSAYAIGEARNWPVGFTRKMQEAKAFYATIAIATLIGMIINFTSINPIKALYWSAVLNGVVAVPVMFVMMKIVCRPDIMGKFAARGSLRALGWLATAVMLVISAAMLVTSI